ncbi:MAG TPA: hypothetical protein VH413_06750 [Verrucomicrobiae bacterium]|jgi:hypothetical protein|nr:hypothetical protein [Verrucomicrobiae bacterium]
MSEQTIVVEELQAAASPTSGARFGTAGDNRLAELYNSVGAIDTEKKIAVLKMNLPGEYHIYAMGGQVNEEMRLACFEYKFLEKEGLIELDLA